jgi:lambda family phage portal protein
MNKGYSEAGASHRKRALKGMKPNSGSPREDINDNNLTLRQRSRMLYMGAPIATSAIRANRTNVIGNGLRLKSAINREVLGMDKEAADAWQKKTELEFELWAGRKNACDAIGMNDFYELQQLCLVSWLLSGDVFALVKRRDPTAMLPYSLRLHLLEADRVRTPTKGNLVLMGSLTTGKADNGNDIYDGVEIGKDGMVEAYHVANTYPYEWDADLTTKFSRVKAYGDNTGLPNILHVMESERPDQYRGVPYLAQAIEPLLQMRRYTDAEITAAVVQSFFAAFVTTESGDAGMPTFNEPRPGDQEEASRDPNDLELGAGTLGFLEKGEDIKVLSPSHPNNNFDGFIRSFSEQIGASLEVPADLLLKSFNSSYSASRGALLEAWKAFKMRRTWMTNDFCKPVYEIWLTEAVARGRISAPGFLTDPIIRLAYLQSEWIGPSQGQLDPTKEITAAVMAIENGLSTREQETIRLNGGEFSANVDKLAVENQLLAAANGEETQSDGMKMEKLIGKIVEKAVKKEEQKKDDLADDEEKTEELDGKGADDRV